MQPHITISSLDAERLEALLDSARSDDATSRALLEELARAEILAPQDMPPDVVTMIVAKIPVGRLGQAHEIARAVAFLVSEDAGFITGSTMSVNGGQHMY